ncbi:MAG: cytochrome c oxidase subunit II [Hyphomonadaceae bacterium]|nr:cytochrome c oxidase subunit II [Hyphomonadaceae bacterium]
MSSALRTLVSCLGAASLAGLAHATGPTPGALGLQPAATRIAERLHFFNDFLTVIMVVVSVFVMALLAWVMVRYNKRAHPEPRKFSHNTLVEVVWTVFPVLILAVIALPSFTNLFYIEQEPDLVAIAEAGDMDDPNVYPEAAAKGWITVKAQGNQWNWTYEYADIVDDEGYPLSFVSNPLHKGRPTDKEDYERATGRTDFDSKPVNLAVDYPMVVPVGRYIRYQTTASDVIHSWTVPSFGVKTDAVPGKLNEGWFLVTEPGVYYGQCSELCGVNHAFMPIEVRVVSEEDYALWSAEMLNGNFEGAVQVVDAALDGEAVRFAEVTMIEEQ